MFGTTCFLVVDLSMKVTCVCFVIKFTLEIRKFVMQLNKKLTIKVLDYFPVELSYGVIIDGSVNFFVHCSISDRQKLYGSNGNFGTLFMRS